MTRYCIFLLSLFALSSLKVFADNQTIGITLNAENNYRDSSYLREMGEILIVAAPNNNNDKARVSIQVKNTTGDGRGLLLFNSDYTEKETKKLKKDKIISYDIEWSDLRKANVNVKMTNGLQEVFYISQGDVRTLPLQIPEMGNEEKELKLIFYPCEVKKKNKEGQITKVRIHSEESFLIRITVELGPDVVFEELKSSCEALVSKIENATFCPKEQHKHGSIQNQVDALEAEYKAKIYEINQSANRHSGIYGHDEIDDSKYGQLKRDIEQAFSAKMDDLRSKSPSCIRDCCPPPPVKKCKYCNLPKGKGKNQCHGYGSCDTHHKPIGCSKGCPENHPKVLYTWEKAAKELEAISKKLNRGTISCADAKKQAKSIRNKANKEAKDVKNKPSAVRKYNIIMDCK